MFKLFRNAVVIMSLMLSAVAQASLEIVITEGIDSARPIAILPFTFKGANLPKERIDEVIAADLMRSGKFSPLASIKMPQRPPTSAQIDYAAWSREGVEAIRGGGENVRFDAQGNRRAGLKLDILAKDRCELGLFQHPTFGCAGQRFRRETGLELHLGRINDAAAFSDRFHTDLKSRIIRGF